MAYERDRDHVTRGPGAIAAADHVSSALQRRRIRIAHATKTRDRRMAAVADGALGALGLMPVLRLEPRGGISPRPPRMPPPPPTTVIMTGPPAPTMPPSIPVSLPPPLLTPPSMLPPVSAPPPAPVATPPPPVVSPPFAPPPSSSGSTSTASSGSGPPSVLVTGGPGSTVNVQPLPDTPSDSDVTGTGQSNTVRNVLLIGGGIALAYLLLRKRGST